VKHGEVILGRYELLEPIGRGGQGETWRALDRGDGDQAGGQEVALKELELAQTPDWKTLELFEREAKVLASLDHEQIPDYIDAFHFKDESRFFIAQEFVDGLSLAERIDQGAHLDEDEALALLESLLEVVAYLHAQNPPVVHRDIKPANIVVADADNVVYLVDFGAVQSVLPDQLGGSTIVGTTGYLPPEQLMGRARPASDLYAIGATLVHLLSGKHPAEFDMHRNRLEYHHAVNVEPWVCEFIDRLLEPIPEDRFATAGDALDALRRLRGGDPLGDKLARTRTDGGLDWLSRTKTTTLVDNHKTPALNFQIVAQGRSRIDEGLTRKPGTLHLELTDAQVKMTFESGLPGLRPEYPALALMVAVALVLVVPMAWPAKFGLSALLMVFGIASAWLFYRPVRRRLVLTPLSYELADDDNILINGDLDALGAIEISDDGRFLIGNDPEQYAAADGLSQAQARWLRARLAESLYQLRRHGRLLDIDDKR
jgi:serine/threonine protein kinase